MSGEIHILPAEELERIKRAEFERGRQAALIEVAMRTGFGKRFPTIRTPLGAPWQKTKPMRGT